MTWSTSRSGTGTSAVVSMSMLSIHSDTGVVTISFLDASGPPVQSDSCGASASVSKTVMTASSSSSEGGTSASLIGVDSYRSPLAV